MNKFKPILGTLLFLIITSVNAEAQDAKEIVRLSETKYNGEKTSYSEMIMTIVRPKYKRSIEFKNWAENGGDALTLITAPAKEKGQTFLKSGNNMWSWNPTIQRLIKLPPSMLSQGWMGSDFSNDDILKESSLVKDYTHKLTGKDVVEGLNCLRIELTPLEDAGVVWGKVVLWISEKEYFQMKSEFYDEEGFLVKTHKASDIKTFEDRKLPSVIEIIPADEPGNKTLVAITKMNFNVKFNSNFFTQQNMKLVK